MIATLGLLLGMSLTQQGQAPELAAPAVDRETVRAAGAILGLDFTDAELELMVDGVVENLRAYERLRRDPLANSVAPALAFDPLAGGVQWRPSSVPRLEIPLPEAERPERLEDLAYADIPTWAALIKSRRVTCEELCEMYLARLRRLDERLACVITFTEDRARRQAAELDRELEAGRWRGLLHGIPYGAKDLLSVRGYPTTWGAKPFANQRIEEDATVVRRLDEAGAVLIAKLSLGALAMDDVWFGGQTKNPWNPEQGSSGSSAGSASATAAGGVVFSIGSETLGSIVSPSARCGCSSLRPTFGRVSRHGAMALSWSMDKLGPICRSARDAAIVLDAIEGPDGLDETVQAFPYGAPGDVDVKGFRVGYLEAAFERSERERHVLDELRELGVELVPIELPDYPVREMVIILDAEAAAAFDELTRGGRDDELVRQDARSWPNLFRVARLVPAVEYIRANRMRTLLMRDMERAIAGIDAYVHPSFGGNSLTLTNLTGHPTLVAPAGLRDDGTPTSISFTGQLFGEERLLAIAHAWQRATGFHKLHPKL